jgi:hypothetical protein
MNSCTQMSAIAVPNPTVAEQAALAPSRQMNANTSHTLDQELLLTKLGFI